MTTVWGISLIVVVGQRWYTEYGSSCHYYATSQLHRKIPKIPPKYIQRGKRQVRQTVGRLAGPLERRMRTN